MERLKHWTSQFVWPDTSTEDGLARACSIGAWALLWISSTYGISLLKIMAGDSSLASVHNDSQHLVVIVGSAGAAIATAYLAVRIWEYRCQIAAWLSLLWIGYRTIDAFLGISADDPPSMMILLFASFQGVRGCASFPD